MNKLQADLKRENKALRNAFYRAFNSLTWLNLETGEAHVLHARNDPQASGERYPWEHIVRYYCTQYITESDRRTACEGFSLAQLRHFSQSGRRQKCLEIRCQTVDGVCEWIELCASVQDDLPDHLLITTRTVSERRLLQAIVDRYVYRNCDYFICIDAKTGSYTILNENDNGAPTLPSGSSNFERAFAQLVHQFVALEDRGRVLQQTRLSHVLSALESEEEHSLYFGMLERGRGYTRKRLQFMYCDRAQHTLMLTCTDVTRVYQEERDRRDQLRQARREAQTDSLTQVYNHQAICSLVNTAIAERRPAQAALLFVDLDDFKSINDTFGHPQGDRALCRVADELRRNIRASDLIGRVGGDEFVIFLSDVDDRESVARHAARLCRVQEQTPRGCDAHVSISIGIALYPEDGADYEALAHRADRALYRAKHSGKNRFAFHSER